MASIKQDWDKLVRMMTFLKKTEKRVLILEADDTTTCKWSVDSAFAVHHNMMRSHTGMTLTLGKGVAIAMSSKQKLNTRSSTEAELVASA